MILLLYSLLLRLLLYQRLSCKRDVFVPLSWVFNLSWPFLLWFNLCQQTYLICVPLARGWSRSMIKLVLYLLYLLPSNCRRVKHIALNYFTFFDPEARFDLWSFSRTLSFSCSSRKRWLSFVKHSLIFLIDDQSVLIHQSIHKCRFGSSLDWHDFNFKWLFLGCRRVDIGLWLLRLLRRF
jgi:hypothetical protein